MANVLSPARDIKIRFGGVVAADGIDLDVLEANASPSSARTAPARRRSSTSATGYLRPQAGTVTFHGHEITAQPPRKITRLGIARAFQIPQLFLDQTVMECMLIAAASRERRCVRLSGALADPGSAEMERLLDLVGVQRTQNARRGNCPRVSASWSISRSRSRSSRSCC